MLQIEKPVYRGHYRQIIGRELYVFRRNLHWWFGRDKYARTVSDAFRNHVVFEHKSIVMRKLQNVDMQLQQNKFTNLRLAIAPLNGIVIRPGETFSIWRLVGRPTAKKGYLDGLILRNGQVTKGTAGGLCQLGNLLFWIFAHSPLTITERYRHGFDVFPDVHRTIPFGAGATLSYNYIDLQVRNYTSHTFTINLWLDDTYLHGALWSDHKIDDVYDVEERNHYIDHQIWGGYARHNQIFQVMHHPDGSVSERLLVENHAIMMYNPFLPGKEEADE